MTSEPQTPGRARAIATGGPTLAVTEYGGDGPPLVPLPGIGSRGVSWWPVVDDLAARFRLYVPDLRGHGASAKPPTGYLLPDYAADLAALLDALGLERPLLLGHSLGGLVALTWAVDHPARAAAIALEETALRSQPEILAAFDGWLALSAMPLDAAAAERAVTEKVAAPLGYDAVRAADAIIQVANANMADAVRLISIRRGYDPRDFCLVAFGGAGSVHAAHLARELDIPAVVVPPYPGITSALGCLLLDVRHDLFRTYLTTADRASSAALEEEFARLEAEARERLATEGITGDRVQLRRLMDMRYVGQWRSLTVPVSTPLEENLDASLARFHAEHEREYAYSDRDQAVEIYGLRVVGLGLVDKPAFPRLERDGGLDAARTSEREVYFGEAGGFLTTAIYDRARLPAGATFDGPAIVEQMDSTVVVPPDWRAAVDDYGNIVLRLRS